jgi:hypothetical protein
MKIVGAILAGILLVLWCCGVALWIIADSIFQLIAWVFRKR